MRKKKLELSLNNQQSAFLILWSKVEDGRLPHGALRSAANFFSVDITTISRLWRGVKNKLDEAVNNQNGEQVDTESLLTDIKFFESGRKQSGRHMKWDVVAMKEAVRNLRLTE
jgi:hypothetical protein